MHGCLEEAWYFEKDRAIFLGSGVEALGVKLDEDVAAAELGDLDGSRFGVAVGDARVVGGAVLGVVTRGELEGGSNFWGGGDGTVSLADTGGLQVFELVEVGGAVREPGVDVTVASS
jgi:hypothetical protein